MEEAFLRQKASSFERKVIKQIIINYLIYIPEGYKQDDKRWPLILFLHGAGERGNNLEIVKRNGIPKKVEEISDFPFITISPQCPEESWWGEQSETLIMMLDEIIKKYNVDNDRVYLTGLSMGGYGTWFLAAQHPEKFAAIAPICGGGDPQWADVLKDIPVWVFHGAKDDIVPIEESNIMVKALRENGNNVKFTVYPDVGHNSWVKAYDDHELYKWFLKH